MVTNPTTHPECKRPHDHTCQVPSGRTCIEPGCERPAGTHWGPFWCPEHDAIRLEKITRQLEELAEPKGFTP